MVSFKGGWLILQLLDNHSFQVKSCVSSTRIPTVATVIGMVSDESLRLISPVSVVS